jgi:hypothetical protein
MESIEFKTTDGSKVEINPNAISEIIEVKEERPGFLFIPGIEAEYEIHMVDGMTFRIEQHEHDKLKNGNQS